MINVEHLTKTYGEVQALSDLSFTIDAGGVYGFLGPNGAGKTTTMNIITGCLSATAGSVTIGGHDVFEEADAAKRLVGYLPEQPPLYLNETPAEYLRFVMTAVVLGKYAALLVVFLVPLAVISVYPLIFSFFGEVYLPVSVGSIFAYFVMGAALIAVGIFLSSLTENQGMAAGFGVAVILFNYYSVSLSEYVSQTAAGTLAACFVLIILIGLLARWLTRNAALGHIIWLVLTAVCCIVYLADQTAFEGFLPKVFKALSLFERLNIFVSGVFDLTALVYFLSVAVVFLFLAVQSLEKRRYN